ncbi:MAG: hypothetical protein WC054_02440 [Candidatus Nanopelagicales bacterium]
MSELLKREPVRAAILPFVVLLFGYLVGKGFVDGETRDFVIAVVTLAVGVLATEAARSKVSPTGDSS